MGTVRDLWVKWKMLKLPWRKTFLVGQDLSGNTFWEFKDKLNANRLRRIVRYRTNAHYADIKISPQWHQWLKHTRYETPSIQEQQADLARHAQLKYLAQQADERWASKPSYLDKPKEQVQIAPELNRKNDVVKDEGLSNGVQSAVDTPDIEPQKENPWKKADAGTNPGQGWQPQTWIPGAARR